MESFSKLMDDHFRDRMDEWQEVTDLVKKWKAGDSISSLRELGHSVERHHFRAHMMARPQQKGNIKAQHFKNLKKMEYRCWKE